VTHCVGDVVDHDGGLRAAVVHGRQAVVALLTRRVPDLKLDRRVVQAHGLREEGGYAARQRERDGERRRRRRRRRVSERLKRAPIIPPGASAMSDSTLFHNLPLMTSHKSNGS